MRRFTRIAGTLMAVAGVGFLAWALTVWQWQDPFTAALNALEQRQLAGDFDRRLDEGSPGLAASGSGDDARTALARAAVRWRKTSERGDAIARIRIPALGLSKIVVNGTDHRSLRRGPGRYLGSAMPGEGELVYVAGHRTTYGAPFSRIDHLRKGDRITLELPFATFEYRVTGSRIVDAAQTSVLKSKGHEQLVLQACHPRFFASHRLLVYARPVRVTPRGTDRPVAFRSY
ncbi:MAG: class E sortase [Thermoleophilia bacterium]|nr:class E sortase [Thermoleophilia bacterium]